jgi:hypothetical protein
MKHAALLLVRSQEGGVKHSLPCRSRAATANSYVRQGPPLSHRILCTTTPLAVDDEDVVYRTAGTREAGVWSFRAL